MLHVPALTLLLILAQDLDAAPATQPTLEQLRAEHKQLVVQEWSALPERTPTKIGKLISMNIEGGHLHLKPLIDVTNGAVAIGATDWPGWLQVTVGDPERLVFHLKHVDISHDNEIGRYTTLITHDDYLQINRDTETVTGVSSVTLIQSRQFADENDDPCRLTISIASDDAAKPDFNLVLSAPSFEQLRLRHPSEVRTYLGPIFDDIGVGELAKSDGSAVAWQVLTPDVEIDPKLQARVTSLIEKLNSAEAATRKGAEAELATLGAPAAAALQRMELSRLDADLRATIDTFVNSQHPVSNDIAKSLRQNVSFLLDSLLLDDPAIRKASVLRLGELKGVKVDLPDTLPKNEREAKIAELRKTLVQ